MFPFSIYTKGGTVSMRFMLIFVKAIRCISDRGTTCITTLFRHRRMFPLASLNPLSDPPRFHVHTTSTTIRRYHQYATDNHNFRTSSVTYQLAIASSAFSKRTFGCFHAGTNTLQGFSIQRHKRLPDSVRSWFSQYRRR